MTGMKGPTKGFGFLVRGIQNAGEVADNDQAISTPFLNGKVLDVNVPGPRSGAVLVDHVNGRTIVNVDLGGTGGKIAEILEDKAEVLGGLGCMDGGNKFGLSGAGGTNPL
jgi:hypothetical protein